MKSNIIHVGLDVDDTRHHGSALHRDSGEVVDFQCRPTLKGLLVQIRKLSKHFPPLDQDLLRDVLCGLQPAAGSDRTWLSREGHVGRDVLHQNIDTETVQRLSILNRRNPRPLVRFFIGLSVP